MNTKTGRLFSALLFAVGLLALVILWMPLTTTTAMTFAGPKQIQTRFGVLGWRIDTFDYRPYRLATSFEGARIDLPPPVPGELRQLDPASGSVTQCLPDGQSTIVHSEMLALTIALTLGVLVCGVGWPGFALVRAVRPLARPAQEPARM